MAYFPNGQSGDIYMDQFCFNCYHWQDLNDGRGPGCPVWDMHLVHNGEEPFKDILNNFIPMDEKFYPKQCLMFVGQSDIEGQLKLWT